MHSSGYRDVIMAALIHFFFNSSLLRITLIGTQLTKVYEKLQQSFRKHVLDINIDVHIKV